MKNKQTCIFYFFFIYIFYLFIFFNVLFFFDWSINNEIILLYNLYIGDYAKKILRTRYLKNRLRYEADIKYTISLIFRWCTKYCQSYFPCVKILSACWILETNLCEHWNIIHTFFNEK